MRSLVMLGALVALSVTGCRCQCGNTVVISGDGGAGAGNGGGSGGGGGGGGAGQGGGTGGGSADGGNGTTTGGVGPGGFTLDGGVGGTGTGVKVDPNGHIVLDQASTEFHFMWIANNTTGWVSKYDTRTAKEVGRYWSVIPRDCANSAGPPCAGGNVHGLRADTSQNPSRTAIDLYGDMWVANRAVGGQGSVTKIANDTVDCIDRNNNGTIETSQDRNGDGQISMTPADGEMIIPTNYADPLQYDECVLFTTPVGASGSGVGARAIAVAAGPEGSAGDVWVGIHRESRMYKLSGFNGQIQPVSAGGPNFIQLGIGPYGAVVDRLQRLWVVGVGEARLALIDTGAGTLVSDTIAAPANENCNSYGMAIDGKNRVWLAGWTTGARACRYDHATTTWTGFDFAAERSNTGTAFAYGRGIAVDASGQVYMSGWNTGAAQLIRFDADTGAVIPFGASRFIDAFNTDTHDSIGVGIDFDGDPWVNNSSGNAMKIDATTGAVTRTPQQPAGLYTYSDFTGYQLRNFTAPRGTYRKDFEGCDDQTQWLTLTWDALKPPNTNVQAFVKAANTLTDLNASSTVRYGAFLNSPVDLVAAGVPRSKYVRVEFVLTSADGTSTPVLRSFNLVWSCGSDIN